MAARGRGLRSTNRSPAFGCEVSCEPAVVTQIGAPSSRSLSTAGPCDVAGLGPRRHVGVDGRRPDVARGRLRVAGSPAGGPRSLRLRARGARRTTRRRRVGALRPGNHRWQAVESPAPSQPSIQPTPSATLFCRARRSSQGPITFKQATTVPKVSAQPWDTNTMSYANGHFYNVFNRLSGSLLWESDDGTTWPRLPTRPNQRQGKAGLRIHHVARRGRQRRARGGRRNGQLLHRTVTATAAAGNRTTEWTWRKATIQPSQTGVLVNVAYSGGNLIAAGQGGEVLYSADPRQDMATWGRP